MKKYGKMVNCPNESPTLISKWFEKKANSMNLSLCVRLEPSQPIWRQDSHTKTWHSGVVHEKLKELQLHS